MGVLPRVWVNILNVAHGYINYEFSELIRVAGSLRVGHTPL